MTFYRLRNHEFRVAERLKIDSVDFYRETIEHFVLETSMGYFKLNFDIKIISVWVFIVSE